jgi:hypothetical protein
MGVSSPQLKVSGPGWQSLQSLFVCLHRLELSQDHKKKGSLPCTSPSKGWSCWRNELTANRKEVWGIWALLCFVHGGDSHTLGTLALMLLASLASLLQCLLMHIYTHAQTFLLSAGEALPPPHSSHATSISFNLDNLQT